MYSPQDVWSAEPAARTMDSNPGMTSSQMQNPVAITEVRHDLISDGSEFIGHANAQGQISAITICAIRH